MRGNAIDKLSYWLFSDRIPLTKGLILSNGITYILGALGLLSIIPRYLGYSSDSVATMPWTLATHPLVSAGGCIISILFSLYWLWIAGGSLERSWGTKGFASYFFIMSVISALGLLAGGLIAGIPTSAIGLWLPIAGLTVAFAMLNPEQQILFFFVIPLKLKYLALMDAVIVLISYGSINILLGITALAGCAFSYWYVRSGKQYGWREPAPPSGRVVRVYQKRGFTRWLNPLNWLRERRERKRLRDLFNKSGME